MLGQPYYMSIPEVIGVKLSGRLKSGVTATDLVLTITERLREQGVVEKFVEYFGPGLKHLSVPDRATISNMSPEYGATMGIFPVDEKTIDYLKMTNRDTQARLTDAYTKAAGLFYSDASVPQYTQIVEVDLEAVEPSLAGPARPKDRIALTGMKTAYADILGCEYDRDAEIEHMSTFHDESGCQTQRREKCIPVSKRRIDITIDGTETAIGDGNVVIAAITSCTNTSNPHVLIGAGLLAQNAVARGLTVPPYVKTSLAPGSRVVIDYLQDAGVMPAFEALGFHLAAFGCTTCIGNSGPLNPAVEKAVLDNDFNVASVLSGNRNFEARIHQNIKSNFLASPMLVVAYALAGRMDIDLSMEPLGCDASGQPAYLDQIWPAMEEIDRLASKHVKKEFYRDQYSRIFDGDAFWKSLEITESTTYAWDPDSTYIKKPPYFEGFKPEAAPPQDVREGRCFLLLGDSVTTDHISPAGAIPADYPAGRHLIAKGVEPDQFNSYGSRRGNHKIMMRGTFGNIRIKNKLVGTKEGAYTLKFPEQEQMFNFEAAMRYRDEKTPLIILGGVEYGAGSSRDWAAKGSSLLGVRAVVTQSYERIHRNNLVGMGVLPLIFKAGESADSLGLDGSETYFIEGIEAIQPRKTLQMRAVKSDGREVNFEVTARLDTEVDLDYFNHGGILPYVLRKLVV
jgi:aconitate hydratase